MKIATVAASLLFLSGCTPLALNPFYTARDLTRDAAFPGLWQKAGDSDRMICEESGEGYECEVIEREGSAASFDVCLMRLGEDLYADLYPKNPRIRHGVLKAHLLPVHTLARLRREGNTLRIALLSDAWVKQRAVSYFPVGPKQEDVLLTLPTKELRALVAAAAADPKGFTDPEEWRKVR